MIKHSVVSVQALRNLHEKGQLVVPDYQRVILKVDNLKKSLEHSSRNDGFIPAVIVLRVISELKNRGKLEIVDGRRRVGILIHDKKVAGATQLFTVELTDYTRKQAIAMYKRMNNSGVVHTTGEKLRAELAQQGVAPSLQTFVKKSVWAIYEGEQRNTRFRHLPIAMQYFFESQAESAKKWGIPRVPTTLAPLEAAIPLVNEDDVNEDALEAIITRFQHLQQVVEKVFDAPEDTLKYPLTGRFVYWPAAWLHVAIGEDSSLLRKSVKRLAEGFINWRNSVKDSLDTSHPERAPKGEGTHIANLKTALIAA